MPKEFQPFTDCELVEAIQKAEASELGFFVEVQTKSELDTLMRRFYTAKSRMGAKVFFKKDPQHRDRLWIIRLGAGE